MSSAAALKAWDTRRANGGNATAAKPTVQDRRNPDTDLMMQITIGESDGLPEIACSFVFMNKNKPAEMSALSMADRALLSIRLVSSGTAADSSVQFIGHDRTQAFMSGGTADMLDAVLPRMKLLDSVLAQTFDDSEDSSLPMAIQAISWNLRVDYIECLGKRSKRGIAYAIGETIIESIVSPYSKSE